MAKVYCVVTYILNTVVFGTIVNVAWSTLAVKVSRNPEYESEYDQYCAILLHRWQV